MVYEGQKATIVGLGREGLALAKFLVRHGAKVTVTDTKDQHQLKEAVQELEDLPIHYQLGGHPEDVLQADVMFVSPGVPRQIPILVEARKRGVALSSETALFFSLCKAPIIGITGSSGKTTTTSLVGEIMKEEGYRTFVGGNIGSPLIESVEQMGPSDRVVMELSSFQLEAMNQSPHVAAVLNLSPNHLDRHQSMDEYLAAKKNIVRFQTPNDYAVLNADQQLTRGLTEESMAKIVLFSREQVVAQGAFIDNGHIVAAWAGQRHIVCATSEIRLLGLHNLENAVAACAIAAPAGAQTESMRRAVTAFRGVEHRLELVAEIDGVRFYDDSIATSPQRTMAALEAFSDPVVLLAGGREKHLPLEALARLILEKVKAIVLFGEAAPLLERAIVGAQDGPTSGSLVAHRSSDLKEAVITAVEIAEDGDIVLLSPACTSYDMYRDFAERGDHFKALVREFTNSQKRADSTER